MTKFKIWPAQGDESEACIVESESLRDALEKHCSQQEKDVRDRYEFEYLVRLENGQVWQCGVGVRVVSTYTMIYEQHDEKYDEEE